VKRPSGDGVRHRPKRHPVGGIGDRAEIDSGAAGCDYAQAGAQPDESQPPVQPRRGRLDGVYGVGSGGGEIARKLPLPSSTGGDEGKADVMVAPSELLGGVEDAGPIGQPGGTAIGSQIVRQPDGRSGVEWLVGSGRRRAKRLRVPASEEREQEQQGVHFSGVRPHRDCIHMCHWCVGEGR